MSHSKPHGFLGRFNAMQCFEVCEFFRSLKYMTAITASGTAADIARFQDNNRGRGLASFAGLRDFSRVLAIEVPVTPDPMMTTSASEGS